MWSGCLQKKDQRRNSYKDSESNIEDTAFGVIKPPPIDGCSANVLN